MLNKFKVRQLLEARRRTHGLAKGSLAFVHEMQNLLGIADAQGNFYKDAGGNRFRQAEAKLNASQVSIRAVAEAVCGEEWANSLHPDRVDETSRIFAHFESLHGANGLQAAFEAGPGIDVTQFLNVNTFSQATAGLVEAKILEAYDNPQFVLTDLVQTVPTNLNGEKMIGTTTIGDKSERRNPGMPHKRVGFGERWVETPETHEDALACEVNRETIFFDRTTQIYDRAESIGFQLGYRKEVALTDNVAGLTSSSEYVQYTYNGTAYDPYQASSPWINDHVNAALNRNSIDASLQLFMQLTDQENGQPIVILPDTILTIPSNEENMSSILYATEIEQRTNAGVEIRRGPSRLGGKFKLVTSIILYQRLTGSADGGGGLSAGNEKRWWMSNFQKALVWMQNWPLTTNRVSPNEYVMLDNGIIFAVFANQRGTPAWKEPRAIVRNKVA